jgi:hypothetical protein
MSDITRASSFQSSMTYSDACATTRKWWDMGRRPHMLCFLIHLDAETETDIYGIMPPRSTIADARCAYAVVSHSTIEGTISARVRSMHSSHLPNRANLDHDLICHLLRPNDLSIDSRAIPKRRPSMTSIS